MGGVDERRRGSLFLYLQFGRFPGGAEKASRKHGLEKSADEKSVAWQGLDEGDQRWRWIDGIRGESLHVAESGRGPLTPPATVQPSIR
jgi:hypothetical protein